MPGTGIIAAYTTTPEDAAQLANGLGIWVRPSAHCHLKVSKLNYSAIQFP